MTHPLDHVPPVHHRPASPPTPRPTGCAPARARRGPGTPSPTRRDASRPALAGRAGGARRRLHRDRALRAARGPGPADLRRRHRRVRPGDAFVIAAGFRGTWESIGRVTKVYAILEPGPAWRFGARYRTARASTTPRIRLTAGAQRLLDPRDHLRVDSGAAGAPRLTARAARSSAPAPARAAASAASPARSRHSRSAISTNAPGPWITNSS